MRGWLKACPFEWPHTTGVFQLETLNSEERYSNLHNVTFAPRVEKEMVPSILERCDLTYFTTVDSKVWRYGQSLNKIIDYMHNGKPIVAEYSGYPSMINESKCGVFIKNEDIDCLEDNFINFGCRVFKAWSL